ncbi:cytochrome P450 [Actinoplanes subtropicus]|uniref:cytochrome P450 n=1 Tax=Actinoplanes subtropicus TaxID=543632 RepID=UPI0004C47461|nr:cytochrome P450 [Actinoplanes subtropicus]
MDADRMARLDDLQRDPYGTYERARRTPGLTFVPELNAWLVSRQADAREVLRRPAEFSSANALLPDVPPSPAVIGVLMQGIGGSPTVVTSDGDAHQRYRAPLSRGLSPARVAAVVPYLRERAAALVDSFADVAGRQPVDLVERYARRLPGEVIGHLLGLAAEDVPVAISGSYRAEQLLFRPLPEEEQLAAARDVVALQHLLDGYARARRADPRDDLCTEMVSALAPGDGELSFEQRGEIVSNLQNLLIAGHLTTTALIGSALLHLLRDRAQWELLCERPELIPAAVEEAARYDTAVQGFRRVTTRPVTIAGTDLPAGAAVFVAFGSANRDEAAGEQPDVFDITRAPVRHLAFGHGVHGCPGAQLAREQVKITLETLTERLPGLRLAPGEDGAMLPTMIHRSPRTLTVEL